MRKVGKHVFRDGSNVLRQTTRFLREVVSNLDLTIKYTDMNRYCGYLEVDGTYIAVKGFRKKLVVIWGIDYLTHDIPHFIIGSAENYQTMLAYFKRLKLIGYNLQYLVCDDNEAIKMAAKYIYPKVIIQACLKHYRESMKRDLGLKVSDKYLDFYLTIESMFKNRLCNPEVAWEVAKIYAAFKDDPRCVYWLTDIMQRREELTNYHMYGNTPNTTGTVKIIV